MNFHRMAPPRSAAWRCLLAKNVSQPHRRLQPGEHDVLDEPIRYIRSLNAANSDQRRATVRRRFPDHAAAHDLSVQGGVVRDELEARILARQAVADIAAVMSLPVGVVEKYAVYFFDLPADGHGTDWVLLQVLRVHEWRHRNPAEGEIWKFMAIAGGQQVLDVLVGDYKGTPAADPVHRHELAEKARFLVRDKASMRRSFIPDDAWFAGVVEHFGDLFAGPPRDAEEAEFRLCVDVLKIAAGKSLHDQSNAASAAPSAAPVTAAATDVKAAPASGVAPGAMAAQHGPALGSGQG